ncbi:OLC1v1028816C1 [Oldenlandia corymbosa var. corymbosa]|uniref:OLC1v1028816C1 n=1 Tax=Oldenlandia corymbosa var. corymbosa TaxID=529605 RepID=A0AAV1CFD9_OLDCO|nr:OLC1v1028816C1 [Oldenlandia corymbosa var. corymbosa]
MVNLIQRLFGSVVSTIAHCFFVDYHYQHQEDHHHRHNHHHHHHLRHHYHRHDHHKPYKMPKAKGRPLSLQTVELKVRMCCAGCERVVKDAIKKLRGVDSVEVDLPLEKVTVIGYVDRNKVLKAVRRAGKRAEFWPFPNPPLYYTSTNNYFRDMTSEYKESYNYWRHGYNNDATGANKHGILPVTHRGDDKVSNLFNDDNVNACSVM